MWLLGAGASASAGLPTAMDMIWEFKRVLYISQSRSPGETWTDLSQPAVRNRIDAHIESMGGMPSPGAPDEYAALFAVDLHEMRLVLSRDGRVFAEIQENITGRLRIQSHIDVHGGALAPRQRALV